MKSYPILLLLAATMATAAAAQNVPPQVTHVWAQQRPNTRLVDVNYSVVDPDNSALSVRLTLLDGSGSVVRQCTAVTGDVGAGVAPGANRHITWDAGVDFQNQHGGDYRLRVTADDGVGPTGFALVPPGTFMMGSPTTEPSRFTNETLHQVTLTRGIYVQTTEVTNQQYRDLAQWAYNNGHVTATTSGLYDNLDGSTQLLKSLGAGSYEITFSAGVFSCINPTHPVKYVTWYGAVAYCDWLSLQQGLPRAYNHSTWQCNAGNPYTATGYRLPTEAEWEYACRAGTQTPFNTGACLTAGTQANYDGRYPYTGCLAGPYVGWTVPVGSYPANAFGLYDMHGNLWEWCNDWWGTYGGTVTDPVGAGAGSYRVIRGGSWDVIAQYCRSASRSYAYPVNSRYIIGFRPVRSTS
jgi:formylglycine-generating enzyme required for sulfatase activity